MASAIATIPTTTLAALTERRAGERDQSSEGLATTKVQLLEALKLLVEARTLQDAKIWSNRTSLTGPIVKAVEQYYLMFGRGLVVPGKDREAAKEAHDLQVGFLKNYMDEDVRFGDERGRSIVYEQWKRYALYHAAMQVAMVGAEVKDTGDESSTEVVAKGTLTVKLDRATLEFLFPHILSDEPLVQQLVGREVTYDTSTTYLFNAAGQCVAQDLAVDFHSGFRKMLGDDSAASKLLRDALIHDHSKLGLVEEP
ncbi:hypothetical protein PybrP1_002600 [[Pythium] brassicae (nom. inval.)]|nr:hypothetical protein PybrP1_002600 [[Pythium] brassicae (nom. inval.)]